jgi:hypothetical protein
MQTLIPYDNSTFVLVWLDYNYYANSPEVFMLQVRLDGLPLTQVTAIYSQKYGSIYTDIPLTGSNLE